MRKIAIARVVTVAAALPFLGGTVASHAAEGPWCHTFGGGMGGIENGRFRRSKCAALRSRATADPAHQTRIGWAMGSSHEGPRNRPACTLGPGGKTTMPVTTG